MTSTVPFLVADLSLIMLTAAIVVAFIRLLRGPSVPDRVVALDLIATLAVGVIAVEAIALDEPLLLRAAVVLALITFVGTVAFGRYIEKGTIR
jgi:multicomponent Na+:H+ antiporter subunit F